MSSSPVYDAIKARLVDQLGGTYAIRDFEEIEVALQQATDPWIVVEDSGGNNELLSIGSPSSNWTGDDGFVDVHVFTPSTSALSAARSICEQVRAVLFYYTTAVTPGTLRVLTVDPPSPGLIQDGLWNSMLVQCQYNHQYVRATVA